MFIILLELLEKFWPIERIIMDIVKIHGGLGNQMFQYALVKKLEHLEHEVKIELSTYIYFSVNLKFSFKKLLFLLLFRSVRFNYFNRRYQLEKIFNLKSESINDFKDIFRYKYEYINQNTFFYQVLDFEKKGVYYNGQWSSYKYFNDIHQVIKKMYRFPEFDEKRNIELAKILMSTNSVSIHVRRGDYVSSQENKDFFYTCDIDYFEKAIDYVIENIENPFFVFFSDDPNFVNKNFKHLKFIIVDWNKGKNSFRDMQLMSICKNNIIPNSSFSWWAAYLNSNPNKVVIGPKIWSKNTHSEDYHEILLPDWIAI